MWRSLQSKGPGSCVGKFGRRGRRENISCLSAWVVRQGVDGLAGAQSLNPREKQVGDKCWPWVCCVTLGSYLTFLSQFPHLERNCCED